MVETARRTFVATIVVIAVVACALWKIKLVVALVFLGFIFAAAMRPGVDRLAQHRIPRPIGVLSTPILALIATQVDVIVRDKDPAEEDVPAVLFAKESRS